MIETLLLTFASLITIFGWAFFSFWSAIPAGIALAVSPLWVCLTVIASYASGVLLVVVVGGPIRQRIQARLQARQTIDADIDADEDAQPAPNRMVALMMQAWHRFGLVGLALLAPMTVGSQVGAVIGLGFGAPPVRLVIAMTLGAAVWAIGLTLAVVLGVMAIAP